VFPFGDKFFSWDLLFFGDSLGTAFVLVDRVGFDSLGTAFVLVDRVGFDSLETVFDLCLSHRK
jgi:hypothetical protein